MSKVICPFCQQELNQDNPQSIECRNDDCKKSYFMYGSKELWQELMRTRKALKIAVKAMESAKYFRLDHCMCCGHDPQKDEVYIKLKKALAEITALEQKDEK